MLHGLLRCLECIVVVLFVLRFFVFGTFSHMVFHIFAALAGSCRVAAAWETETVALKQSLQVGGKSTSLAK